MNGDSGILIGEGVPCSMRDISGNIRGRERDGSLSDLGSLIDELDGREEAAVTNFENFTGIDLEDQS
jgi:hypothetical protein